MRLVLDTNVLASGLAYVAGPPGRLVAAWRTGAFELVGSEFMLVELGRVLPRMAQRTGLSSIGVHDFLDAFRALAAWVEPDADSLALAQDSGLRDPNDLPVLALAIASGANWLVTGDKDLLALAAKFPILTPAEFCARHAP